MPLALPLIVAIAWADGPAQAKPTVAYYLGESTVRGADGKPMGNLVALLKRESRPAESRIVETSLLVSSRPGEPVQERVEVLTIQGEAFTLKDAKNTSTGDGTLFGPAWAWTSWGGTTNLGPGGTIRARWQVSDRGLAADKALLAPNGAIRATFSEDYATIDAATYELLRAKLLPAPEAPR